MLLKLIENKHIEATTVTIEYKEKDRQVEMLKGFVEHLDDLQDGVVGSAEGKLFRIRPGNILYLESVERKTFCYTTDKVYELELKLYELEEKYSAMDFMRISKSLIVNLQRISSLKPDFGGKILATLENGEKLYISRQYAPVLKKKLGLGGRKA
ncbi:MAG: LytTR family transcriptional regulator [Lachnospiraceae bacterium]|nr:LytTR family transcriptional regulator [Lachnospiraceae bacterium]